MTTTFQENLRLVNIVYLLVVVLTALAWAWMLGMFERANDYIVDIPTGSAEAISNGEDRQIIPEEFLLRQGDRLVLVNQDVEGHRVGGLYVDANSSVTANFRSPGTFTYFCSVHPTGQTIFDITEKPDFVPLGWAIFSSIGLLGLINGMVLGGRAAVDTLGMMIIGAIAAIVGGYQSFAAATIADASGAIGNNPIPAIESSISSGSNIYQQFCSTCHGVEGYGDGPLAEGLDPAPSDLFVHVPQHGDNVLYQYIQEGIPGTAMPPLGSAISGDDVWHLINYLRTIK